MARIVFFLGVALAAWLPWEAAAQPQVRMPTPVAAPGAATPPVVASPPFSSGSGWTPAALPPLSGSPAPAAPAASPLYSSPAPTAIAPAPGYPAAGPPALSGAPSVYAPSPSPGFYPAPGPAAAPQLLPGPVSGPAAFQGGIGAPLDPYGLPGSTAAPLLPQDPYMSAPQGMLAPMTRFLQRIGIEDHWLADTGDGGLGVNETQLSATFACPWGGPESPLLITPGFGLELWDGPVTAATGVDMPPQTYDAYLALGWNPQFSPAFGAELGASVGVYSDFETATTDSIRVQGQALAVAWLSQSFRLKGGVMYVDRNKVKLLPAGGLVWTPNADTRLDLLFPNPRFTRRFATSGTLDWWWYVRGEYGGGAWTVKRQFTGATERMDYNDIRVALGLEFKRPAGIDGFLEVGGSFNRELFFVESDQTFKPDPTVFLGGGIAF